MYFVIWKHMVEDGHLFGATGSIKSDNFSNYVISCFRLQL